MATQEIKPLCCYTKNICIQVRTALKTSLGGSILVEESILLPFSFWSDAIKVGLLSNTWKFGFIKGVDEGRITTVKELESWRFEL